MKKLLLVLMALVICHVAWGTPAAAEDRPVVFTHAVIIDGGGNAPLENGTLIVRGSKIEAVGPGSDIPSPPGLWSSTPGAGRCCRDWPICTSISSAAGTASPWTCWATVVT